MQKASCVERWVEREFGSVVLPDLRLTKRLKQIAADLAHQPQASIPRACGEWSRTKGAYRFFDNDEVSAETILSGHQRATLERMSHQDVMLMVQDTTALNYASEQESCGLGLLGDGGDALGLWLHTTMAVDEQGAALGIMQAQMWTRDPARSGTARLRKQKGIEDKESQRWLTSFQESVRLADLLPSRRLINIADREADIYELFALAVEHSQVGVVIRARHDRRLENEQKSLSKALAAQPAAGVVEITVPRKPGVRSHKAQLEIRFSPIAVRPKHGQAQGLNLWAVEARQIGVSAPKAIWWRLLTNLPVTDFAGAVEKVQWYRLRWRIEEFHRVLKSGCNAEGRQLERVERLKKVLVLDMIVAWRVMELTRVARQSPNKPATELLTEEEVLVLRAVARKLEGKSFITLNEAVRAIAQMGGFLARKSDGEPGAMTIWYGLQRLHEYTTAFSLLSKFVGNA
jgi:hypothetical protein